MTPTHSVPVFLLAHKIDHEDLAHGRRVFAGVVETHLVDDRTADVLPAKAANPSLGCRHISPWLRHAIGAGPSA